MVLLWTLLIFIVSIALYFSIDDNLPSAAVNKNWLFSIPLVMALVAAPLSGWLADAKFGNYKVFRFGAVLLFISTVMNCLLLILEALVWENSTILKSIHLCLASSLILVGGSACIVPALPLGLDQMPDASADSITSYIAWFVGTIFVGLFLGTGINTLITDCANKTMQLSYHLIWALLLTVCMSVVLSSNFLFSPKWLIIEPKSPQSLKAIFQALKFAAKHKAPLNRSAFTYWEEDIPSRIDLGKTKYGGPLTTEQVEDVKTILRLIVITLSFCFVGLSFFFPIATNISVHIYTSSTNCDPMFLLNSFAEYSLLGIVAYEFLFYPLVRNKLPSILKRIGVVSLTTTIVSFVCFILKLTHFLSQSSETATEWIVSVLYIPTSGLLGQFLLSSVFEFMCAQSPYNMRGLLISLVGPLVMASAIISITLSHFLSNKIDSVCTKAWCPLILISVRIVFCLVGFLLFCVVARWYKRRVRDEDYSTQRVVEEVYDRYLTAAAAHTQSRKYGINN